MSQELAATKVKTPVGALWLVAFGDRIWSAEFEQRWEDLAIRLARKGLEVEPGTVRNRNARILVRASRALADYFGGTHDALAAIPLLLEGPAKRVTVWKRVRRVRPGHTMSYAELAKAVEMPGAFRAIGAANGANPCALFVPCHRIVSSDGRLVGYGAGVEAKAWLLAHEGATY